MHQRPQAAALHEPLPPQDLSPHGANEVIGFRPEGRAPDINSLQKCHQGPLLAAVEDIGNRLVTHELMLRKKFG